ncbi:MAG: CHAT domain-containing protein [Thainema sp.]
MKRFSTQSIGLAIALGLSSPAMSPLGLLPEKSAIAQEVTVEERKTEADRLFQEGLRLYQVGSFQQSLQVWQQALAIYREIGDRQGEGVVLGNLGIAYASLGNYEQAISLYEQRLSVIREIGDRQDEAITFFRISEVYLSLGEYQKAFEILQATLAISREIDNLVGEASTLSNIGAVYFALGEFEEAIVFYDSALEILQELEDQNGIAIVLNNLGEANRRLGISSKSLSFYNQALSIFNETGDAQAEAKVLNNIGNIYSDLGNHQLAVRYYEDSLRIKREINDLLGEAATLNNLGEEYAAAEQPQEAMRFFMESLSIKNEIGNRGSIGITLANIGNLLSQQNHPELAIAFLKESVNVQETIRNTNQGLPSHLQESFVETVADDYRQLADLLFQQNRVLEAQRVLDLLKVQELDDYLRGVQRNAQTESGITLRPEELEALERFNVAQSQLIELGRELLELETIDLADRTPEQAERIRELRQLQNDARTDFQTFLESDEIKALITQLRQTDGATNLELSELNTLQDNLRKLEQNAVVLYPLILEDRLELIIVTANSPPLRRTVSVSREDLNRGIAEMRSALQSPSSDAVTPAQQLYDWLIRPIEGDLAQANADTIIYAPDSQLRYIPLAALHDGNQWLTERFRVNNITAASIDDLDNQPTPELEILAAAFSEGQYTVPIRDRTLSFGGLEYAGREVENLSQIIPQTEKRLNEAFDSGIVVDMNDFSVVHLATHATFNPGPPEDSFILFGDGSKATLTDIKSWNFPNVELVVLSACETAVGDVPLGNGEEILGFGYLMQLAGADAAIASLWAVSDGGTQVLMNAFYGALQDGNSKAEALRQAQVALIERNFSGLEIRDRRDDGTVVAVNVETGLPPAVSNNLSHPYYWAPFILIGNGL